MNRTLYFLLFALCLPGLSVAQQDFQHKHKTSTQTVQPAINPVVIDGSQTQSPVRTHRHQPLSVHNATSLNTAQSLWQVEYEAQSGQAIFLKKIRTQTENERYPLPAVALSQYMAEAESLLPFGTPSPELQIRQTQTDDLGHTHIRLQQRYQGIPIYGAEGILHLSPTHEILNGRFVATPNLSQLTPAITANAAAQIAIQDVSQHASYRPLTPKEQDFLGYLGPITEMVLYPSSHQGLRLCYTVELRPNFLQHWMYFIDAENGRILNHYDHTCTVGPTTAVGTDLNGNNRTINVFEAPNGDYHLLDGSKDMYTGPTNNLPNNGDGFIITADLNNTAPSNPTYNDITSNNNSWTPKQVSAHHNASTCYNYFRNTFGRSSIDGSGGDIISFINVAEDNGQGMDNAFWNGAAMFYGNGGGAFTPLAGALDVAGHEMAHGVIQHTANLEYQGQSGALNESFADIFGVLIDRNDWALGEDIIPNTSIFPTGFLRDVSNPHNGHPAGSNPFNSPGYQPRTMSEIYTGSQDNEGVHINSGIPNYAFYKFCEAIGFDKDKAEDVYYRALSQYLSRSSQFVDCRLAVIQAAEDLFGPNSAEVNAAQNAYAAVGLGSGSGGGTVDPNPTLPNHTGQDFIVSSDTDDFTFATLYISSTTGTNFQQLSTTEHISRISVTDDGQVGYFIDEFNNIRALLMDPSNTQEQALTNDGFWSNVAISKDGSKVAAISVNIDTSIYVYDYNLQQWAKFRLYNPTFTQGVSTAGVLYADALEWDYTGEYLLYDAFNRIPNNSGVDREYWDVGEIKVWDNQFNTWGDGTIFKVFTNLPDGISVGNAVYAKNSPNIIAFDYIDENLNELYLLAGNVETGQVGTIFQNGVLSYPSYSKNDDKIIFNATTSLNDPIIGVIPLGADKISATGNASGLIGDARWGVWYVDGQRPLSVQANLQDKYQLQIGPNPMQAQLNVHYTLPQSAIIKMELLDLTGRSLWRSQAERQTAGLHQEQLTLPDLASGSYLLQVWIGDEQQSFRIIKQ